MEGLLRLLDLHRASACVLSTEAVKDLLALIGRHVALRKSSTNLDPYAPHTQPHLPCAVCACAVVRVRVRRVEQSRMVYQCALDRRESWDAGALFSRLFGFYHSTLTDRDPRPPPSSSGLARSLERKVHDTHDTQHEPRATHTLDRAGEGRRTSLAKGIGAADGRHALA